MARSAAALDALRVRIDGLRAVADYAGAHGAAAAAVAGDAVDRAAALVELGRCAADLGRIDEAETAWRDAVRLAGADGAAVRASAGAELALLALRDGMREEAEALADAAILQAAAVGVPDAEVAMALVAAALVLMATGRPDEAGRRVEAASGSLAGVVGGGQTDRVGSRTARAAVAIAGARASLVRVRGDAAAAVESLGAAERLADERLGPSCIEVAALAAERAAALRSLGRSAEAEVAYRTALGQFGAVGGDAHPDAIAVLVSLGALAVERGDSDPAAAAMLLREVLARLEPASPARVEVAILWNNLGGVLAKGGDLDGAAEAFEQALARKDAHGAPSASIVATLVNLGGIERRQGNAGAAEAAYGRALSLLDDDPAPDPRVRSVIDDGLRELARARGPLLTIQPRTTTSPSPTGRERLH